MLCWARNDGPMKMRETSRGVDKKLLGNNIQVADMVVINSLKALVPKTELDNSLEKDTIALQARFNSKMIKKFTAMTQEHDTAFVIITHLTTMIGTMSRN